MTFEEIEKLNFKDYKFRMAERVIKKKAKIEVKDPFVFSKGEKRDYENAEVRVGASVEKPTVKELEKEFEVYKQELIDQEKERLAEIERKKDLKQRFAALPDKHLVFDEAGVKVSNMDAYFRDEILGNEDKDAAEELLKKLEEKKQSVAAKLEEAKNEKDPLEKKREAASRLSAQLDKENALAKETKDAIKELLDAI